MYRGPGHTGLVTVTVGPWPIETFSRNLNVFQTFSLRVKGLARAFIFVSVTLA